MNVYIYAKLQNFIQFSTTVTKLCHIKHDRLVSFYMSLENIEKLRYLQQYDRSLQNLTRWCRTYRWSASLLVSISKNPTRRTVDTLERAVNCIIMRYREFSIFNPWRVMVTIQRLQKSVQIAVGKKELYKRVQKSWNRRTDTTDNITLLVNAVGSGLTENAGRERSGDWKLQDRKCIFTYCILRAPSVTRICLLIFRRVSVRQHCVTRVETWHLT